ncbi:metallophosphoesterase [uncultured Friedmanniella sp.]|uniref:metallophosphoesterase n=1 Tax=uncultured Friedmanniella sp. TaxID=335381 RepID=UPI0035CC20E5
MSFDHRLHPTVASSPRRRLRSGCVLGTAGLLVTAGLVLSLATVAAATAPSCSAFSEPVYRVVNPTTAVSLVTRSAGEATKAVSYGFTDQGTAFLAASSSGTGLVPVHRMYRPATGDYLATKSTTELVSATQKYGYVDQGISFYASAVKADCLQPVQRYRKDGKHRLVTTDADRAALVAAGWTYENVAFYAAPATSSPAPAPAPEPEPTPSPSTGSTFSFAVMPDTQLEVLSGTDTRMVNRANWLVKQKVSFVAHTGDMVNWDTPDHSQMAIAKKSMDVLHKAGIPYTVAIGNHDTEATGVGGSARDPSNTYQLQRDTSTFNSYFKASDFGGVAGAYEKNKIDNVYSTYSAGGYQWLVLSLEFCARPGAVTWAKQVVAAHPDHNVLIATHSYLNGNGDIDSSNQGYGDTSGRQLYDQLVSQYPNVKMVFSGHVGLAEKARVDTGRNGNKIYSFLTTMHDGTTNPVRMFDVDTAAGTVKTRIYAPYTGKTWTEYSQTLTGVTLVK